MTFSGSRWVDLPAHTSAVAENGEAVTVYVSYYLDDDLRPVDPGICLPNLTLTPEHARNLAAALLKAVHEIRCLSEKAA